ncbi:MAG TPA: flagellar basal-body rod protein FlgG [Aliidongia sp.]|nr:flagellar basal-body rod protein FlgG [Aliidongia sp.]
MRAMDIASTGMQAQQLYVEVISNNIANLNTTGFKEQRAEFQDLLYQNLRAPGANSSDTGTVVPVGVQIGIGVKAAAVYRINTQGNLSQTGNPLDIAIQGKGFFQVLQPDGTLAYSRAGSFQLNAQRQLVTADGFLVQPTIAIPQGTTSIAIDQSGEVECQVAGQVNPQNVGQIQLAVFANDAGLLAIGQNLLKETQASGNPTVSNPGVNDTGIVQQSFLETSNVNVVNEITNLITAQRAYEMNSKVIESADQMQQTLSNLR